MEPNRPTLQVHIPNLSEILDHYQNKSFESRQQAAEWFLAESEELRTSVFVNFSNTLTEIAGELFLYSKSGREDPTSGFKYYPVDLIQTAIKVMEAKLLNAIKSELESAVNSGDNSGTPKPLSTDVFKPQPFANLHFHDEECRKCIDYEQTVETLIKQNETLIKQNETNYDKVIKQAIELSNLRKILNGKLNPQHMILEVGQQRENLRPISQPQAKPINLQLRAVASAKQGVARCNSRAFQSNPLEPMPIRPIPIKPQATVQALNGPSFPTPNPTSDRLQLAQPTTSSTLTTTVELATEGDQEEEEDIVCLTNDHKVTESAIKTVKPNAPLNHDEDSSDWAEGEHGCSGPVVEVVTPSWALKHLPAKYLFPKRTFVGPNREQLARSVQSKIANQSLAEPEKVSKRDMMVRHLIDCHEVQPFSCLAKCTATFNDIESLNGHLKSHHPDITSFNCALCKQSWPDYAQLYAHEDMHHSQLHAITCPVQGCTFKVAWAQMIEEMQKSMKSYQFHVGWIICPILGCHVQKATAMSLWKHIDSHLPASYRCAVCKRLKSKVRGKIYDHVKSHHSIKGSYLILDSYVEDMSHRDEPHEVSRPLSLGLAVREMNAMVVHGYPNSVVPCKLGLNTVRNAAQPIGHAIPIKKSRVAGLALGTARMCVKVPAPTASTRTNSTPTASTSSPSSPVTVKQIASRSTNINRTKPLPQNGHPNTSNPSKTPFPTTSQQTPVGTQPELGALLHQAKSASDVEITPQMLNDAEDAQVMRQVRARMNKNRQKPNVHAAQGSVAVVTRNGSATAADQKKTAEPIDRIPSTRSSSRLDAHKRDSVQAMSAARASSSSKAQHPAKRLLETASMLPSRKKQAIEMQFDDQFERLSASNRNILQKDKSGQWHVLKKHIYLPNVQLRVQTVHCIMEGCSEVFSSMASMDIHLVDDHERKPHKCSACVHSFDHADQLAVHLKTHSSERFKWGCDECGMVAKDDKQLKVHIEEVHTRGVFGCPTRACMFAARFPKAVYDHIRIKHRGMRWVDEDGDAEDRVD